MMETIDKICDVFISHTLPDEQLATTLTRSFMAGGLVVFTSANIQASQNVSDVVWEALAECKALVVILSNSEPSSSIVFEIGAAQAWSKPIYAVLAEPASIRLPPYLSHARVVSPGAVDDIVREIRGGDTELSDTERQTMRDIYMDSGIPADRLALNPQQLRRVTSLFNRKSGKVLTGERLLRELLRMRKRGELPGVRRSAS